jgi:hypothetical protein
MSPDRIQQLPFDGVAGKRTLRIDFERNAILMVIPDGCGSVRKTDSL